MPASRHPARSESAEWSTCPHFRTRVQRHRPSSQVQQLRYNPAMRILFFAIAFAASAGDWPQFRGPNATGVAPADANPPVEFGKPVWKQSLPAGHSSPVVWGGRIFLNSFDPASRSEEHTSELQSRFDLVCRLLL